MPFELLIPALKIWWPRPIEGKELREVAEFFGEGVADWVHLALGRAQWLTNGEPWEILCNKEDTIKISRVVIWKNGSSCLVSGYKDPYSFYPATHADPANGALEEYCYENCSIVVYRHCYK